MVFFIWRDKVLENNKIELMLCDFDGSEYNLKSIESKINTFCRGKKIVIINTTLIQSQILFTIFYNNDHAARTGIGFKHL